MKSKWWVIIMWRNDASDEIYRPSVSNVTDVTLKGFRTWELAIGHGLRVMKKVSKADDRWEDFKLMFLEQPYQPEINFNRKIRFTPIPLDNDPEV